MKKKSSRKRRAPTGVASQAGGSAIRLWAHFAWLTARDRSTKGITDHVPHLGKTREDLLERYGRYGKPQKNHIIVPVRLTILPNDPDEPRH